MKLAIWSKTGDIQQVDPTAFDRILVRLQELRVTLTACLVDLPPTIAEKLAERQRQADAEPRLRRAARPPAHESKWLQLLKAPPEDWQPQLAELIARHAAPPPPLAARRRRHRRLRHRQGHARSLRSGLSSVRRAGHEPDLAMPWPAWYEMEGKLPATWSLNVPPQVLPSQIPLYMQEVRGQKGHNLSITSRSSTASSTAATCRSAISSSGWSTPWPPTPSESTSPFPTPSSDDGDDSVQQPQEMLIVLRTLIARWADQSSAARCPIADGIEAFLFERNGKGVLVLWDRGNKAGVKQLALNIGERPILMDLWGNAKPLLSLDPGRVAGTLNSKFGAMPILLMDIDASLAMLRASVAARPTAPGIQLPAPHPPPALHQSLEDRDQRIVLASRPRPAGPSIRQRIPSASIPVKPSTTRSASSSPTTPTPATKPSKPVPRPGRRTTTFTVPLTLQLGLSDVGMQTMALRDGKDVIVQQTIQNYGEKPIDYSSFAIFPGQARQERLVTNLAPGRTTLKRYRFNNVQVSPGMKIRVGVKELNGSRILNDEVEIQ